MRMRRCDARRGRPRRASPRQCSDGTLNSVNELGEIASAEPLPCPLCGYDLRATTAGRCPECGRAFAQQELRQTISTARRLRFETRPSVTTWLVDVARLTFLPVRFFSRIQVQDTPRRLVMFALASAALTILITALIYLCMSLWTAHVLLNVVGIGTPTSSIASFIDFWWSGSTPRNRNISPPVETWFGTFLPTTLAFLSAVLTWPLLTFWILGITRQTLRQASIHRGHVGRCVIYAGEPSVAILIAVPVLLLLFSTAELFIPDRWPVPAGNSASILWFAVGNVMGSFRYALILIWLLFSARLYLSWRIHMRLPHALAVVIASQVILGMGGCLVAAGLFIRHYQ